MERTGSPAHQFLRSSTKRVLEFISSALPAHSAMNDQQSMLQEHL